MRNLEQFVIDEANLDNVAGKEPRVDTKSKNKVEWAVDEPTDNEASEDVDFDSDENTDCVEDLLDKFESQEAFFIVGRAGWGKTSTIKAIAKKYKRRVITVYLDKACAEDLGGLPVPVKSNIRAKVLNAMGEEEEREFAKQMSALPDWAAFMLEHPNDKFLLFFDEMNQAQPDVMNALMPIVEDKTICGIKFDNYFVGAAGNFEEENRGGISKLSGPLKSRFKPLIEWEANTEAAWKQVFKYLHKKWDNKVTKNLVDAFEENANSFENPREIEQKVFEFIYNVKQNGGARANASKYLRRLKNLAKPDNELTRTQVKELEKLADMMFNFVVGNTEEKQSGRRGKNSQQVPQEIQEFIKLAMENGFVPIKYPQPDGTKKNIKFGVCKETISEVIDEDECNAEMLERTIAKFEANGIKWKYEKPQDWAKLKLEDPLDDKWQLTVTSKTKIVDLDELEDEPVVRRRRD